MDRNLTEMSKRSQNTLKLLNDMSKESLDRKWQEVTIFVDVEDSKGDTVSFFLWRLFTLQVWPHYPFPAYRGPSGDPQWNFGQFKNLSAIAQAFMMKPDTDELEVQGCPDIGQDDQDGDPKDGSDDGSTPSAPAGNDGPENTGPARGIFNFAGESVYDSIRDARIIIAFGSQLEYQSQIEMSDMLQIGRHQVALQHLGKLIIAHFKLDYKGMGIGSGTSFEE